MNQAITLENLKTAIEMFYGQSSVDGPSTDEVALNRTRLHEWLVYAENSPEMWPLIWPLLNPKMSDIIQYFGVNALYNKLSRNWDQIKSRSEELKNQIWEVILYYEQNSGSKITLRKLCSSFAVLVLRCLNDNTWPTAIIEMVENLNNANHNNNNNNIESNNETSLQTNKPQFMERLIFTIFESIQVESKKIRFDKNAYILMRSILNRDEPIVMNLVNSTLRSLLESPLFQESSDKYNSFLQYANCLISCSCNWLSFSDDDIVYESAVHVFDSFIKIYSSKLSFSNYTHEETELTQAVYDWMNYVFEINETEPDTKSKSIIRRLLTLFTEKIVPVLENEIKSNGSNDDDIAELVISFAKITELGMTEIFLSIGSSIDNKQTSLTVETCAKIFSTALLCQSVPGSYPIDESFSNQMLPFWANLLQHCDLDEKQTYVGKLDGLFTQLLPILSEKCRLHCFDGELMREDSDLFITYREDIADIFIEIYVHFNKLVLDFFCNCLQQWLASDRTDWRVLEVCLFALQAIGSCVKEGDDCNKIVEILRLVCEQIDFDRYDHQAEVSALNFIKNTVKTTSKNEYMFPVILTFVMKSVRKRKLGVHATLCFKDMLNNCEKNILPYADALFNEFFNLISTNQQTHLLSDIDVIRLLHCLCRLIRIFDMPRYFTAFEMVLSPTLVQIDDGITANDEKYLSTFQNNLEKISTLFTWLKPEVRIQNSETCSNGYSYVHRIVVDLMQKFGRIEQSVYFQHNNVKSLICNMCDTIVQRFAIDLPDLTLTIISFLFDMLQKYNFSPILRIIGNIILAHTEKKSSVDLMQQIFDESFRIIRNKINANPNTITEDEDKFNLVNDYFVMLRHVIGDNPLLISHFSDDVFQNVIDLANNCLLVSCYQIQKNVMTFFTVMIAKKRASENVDQKLCPFMPTILTNFFCVFRRPVPQGLIEPLTTILRATKQSYRSEFIGWLRAILLKNNRNYSVDQFPTEHITRTEKEEFLAMWTAKDRGLAVMSKAVALFAARCVANRLYPRA